jgi:hypothetical protein
MHCIFDSGKDYRQLSGNILRSLSLLALFFDPSPDRVQGSSLGFPFSTNFSAHNAQQFAQYYTCCFRREQGQNGTNGSSCSKAHYISFIRV